MRFHTVRVSPSNNVQFSQMVSGAFPFSLYLSMHTQKSLYLIRSHVGANMLT